MQNTTAFVAACCRWPHDHRSANAVKSAAEAISDWTEAKEAVKSHRVTPLVHLAVKDLDIVPDDFRAWIKNAAHQTARHEMLLTTECLKIDSAFKAAGVNPLHFKGPVLAQIAYGSIALKHSRDLDIFVDIEDARVAINVLENMGYRTVDKNNRVSDRQLTAVARNFKDIGFVHPNGSIVEIHWRFTYNSVLLKGMENNLDRQTVRFANTASVETFGSQQMLLYLTVHGALHHWQRLKWLADLVAFLETLDPDERAAIISEVGNGPTNAALNQALKLCDTLFGTDYSPTMSKQAEELYEYALARFNRPELRHKTSAWDVRFLRDIFVTRHLYTSPWFALLALKSHFYHLEDVMELPLPKSLNFIYPLIRFPSLLIRRIRG